MANYITVSALNNYLKRKFEADVHLGHVFLKGEISNCKLHSRGHLYFSLKDETSIISAIMFQTNASKLSFEPKEGTKVFAEGKVTVYEGTGKYQIVVTNMQPDGIGELFIAYEKLKKELEAEGLFRKDLKKPIPKFPKKIGIVTAPTGAAIRDILSTIKRRYPIAETILFPALVQGENAKFSIVEQIKKANTFDIDVLIVGRGGGSIEDLWAFNEEIVARAIFETEVPVISAVGHEVDFTIADFVADLRAPTPTGAAEMAVPNITEVFKLIENYKIRLQGNASKILELSRKKLEALEGAYVLKSPMAIYEVKEQKLSILIDKLENFIERQLETSKTRLEKVKSAYILKNPLSFYEKDREKIESLRIRLQSDTKSILNNKAKIFDIMINKLDLLNPLEILKKGYSVVSIKDKVINSTEGLKKGDIVDIKMSSGTLEAIVNKIKEN
ncbi:MAG: exodeoxyribonuclease VII large subunit [Bacilli bacterium]|nr:exodeoxyribonuclease VII large subunit [Bacilli bacterium]